MKKAGEIFASPAQPSFPLTQAAYGISPARPIASIQTHLLHKINTYFPVCQEFQLYSSANLP